MAKVGEAKRSAAQSDQLIFHNSFYLLSMKIYSKSSHFLIAAVVLLSACIAAAGQAPAKKPNLLFIVTDQQRVDTMKAYGNSKIRTPNLDKLAGRSFIFDSAYVTQPLCSPSRASIYTGLYPHTHGTWENDIPLDPEVPILSQMLTDDSYVIGYFGKWHLSRELTLPRGIDEFDATINSPKISEYQRFLREQGIKPDLRGGGYTRDLTIRLPKELSKAAYIARKGVDFMERHKDQPFVLFLNIFEPHPFADHTKLPIINVNDDMYDRDEMEIPDSFFADMDPTVAYQKRVWRVGLMRGEFPLAYPRSVEELKDTKARYYGLITLADEMVGRVLDRLEQLGLDENTIVVFTSDHGEMLGDHRLMSKTVTYEESIKVPLLLSVPNMRNGSSRVTRPVSQVDLVPTLLDLLDQPIPKHLQGESWVPFLEQKADWPNNDVVVESNFALYVPNGKSWEDHVYYQRTVITPDKWKLTLSAVGEGELYDLNTDPKEMVNLYYRPEHKAKIKELTEKINAWQQRTDDKVNLNNLNEPWPLKKQ